MELLLKNLSGKENRAARFRTVIALLIGDELTLMDGIVEGVITHERAGDSGFGYDPIFKPNESDVTFAQMSSDDKNKISHRGRATAKLIDKLDNIK